MIRKKIIVHSLSKKAIFRDYEKAVFSDDEFDEFGVRMTLSVPKKESYDCDKFNVCKYNWKNKKCRHQWASKKNPHKDSGNFDKRDFAYKENTVDEFGFLISGFEPDSLPESPDDEMLRYKTEPETLSWQQHLDIISVKSYIL